MTSDGRRFTAASGVFATLLSIGCASSNSVTRMVDGRLVQGRFVASDAYAAYLKGAVLEAQGKGEAALAAYDEAIRKDPHSAELFTRVGALRCVEATIDLQSDGKASPWDAFTRALEVDPSYEEAWTEGAKCHLRRNELDAAASAARNAIGIDPDRSEPAILLALILERQGNLGEARRWLDGLVVRDPNSIEAQEAMAAFAGRTNDEGRREAADRALSQLRPPHDERDTRKRSRATLAEVDAALAGGDVERARTLALSARLSSGALALRAAAIGNVAFAKAQAELVLAADPGDSDARIAAAVAADLGRDDAALSAALTTLPRATTPASPLATLLMAELLGRRVSPEAQKAWENAMGRVADSGDPLIAKVAARR